MMKRLVLFFSLCWITAALFVSSSAYAGERIGYLKRAPLYQKKINIHAKTGIRQGYLKRDVLDKDRVVIYDRCGRRIGHLKET